MLTLTKFALSDAITFAKELKHRCVFDALKGEFANFFSLCRPPKTCFTIGLECFGHTAYLQLLLIKTNLKVSLKVCLNVDH